MSTRVSRGLAKALKKLQNLAETRRPRVRSFAEKDASGQNGGPAPSRAKPSGGSAPVGLLPMSGDGTRRRQAGWGLPLDFPASLP